MAAILKMAAIFVTGRNWHGPISKNHQWGIVSLRTKFHACFIKPTTLSPICSTRWTTSSINRLFKKFRDMGTVDRHQGSGRPRSARMDENNDQVNDMVLSQEDQHRTHSIVHELSQKTGIPKSSVLRIIWKDLQVKSFKKRHAQELTETKCTARKLLLKKFSQFAVNLQLYRWKEWNKETQHHCWMTAPLSTNIFKVTNSLLPCL